MSGWTDTIRAEVPAVRFGRWAAHPSLTYSEADQNVTVGPGDDHWQWTGWCVTHVATGRALPPGIVDGLTRDEAEAIAEALESAGVEGAAYAFSGWSPAARFDLGKCFHLVRREVVAWDEEMRIIVDVVYRTLGELAEIEEAINGAVL